MSEYTPCSALWHLPPSQFTLGAHLKHMQVPHATCAVGLFEPAMFLFYTSSNVMIDFQKSFSKKKKNVCKAIEGRTLKCLLKE